jgi:uncharacterized protein (TIGR03437 family)
MKKRSFTVPAGLLAISGLLVWADANPTNVLTGSAAFSSVQTQKPGIFRKLTPADLPQPYATQSVTAFPQVVARPAGVMPQAPPGFNVNLYAGGLRTPRAMKRAPNGDVFLAETGAGQIRVYRGAGTDGKPLLERVFATGLGSVFGMAFYPSGDNPAWLYVSNTTTVLRFAYKRDDLSATGNAQPIITGLPAGGHITRDLAFSLDGQSLFVALGSQSNADDPDDHPADRNRANVLEYKPDGTFVGVYGSGIRNPVGLAVNPTTGELWCSVNERDGLGDNLVPDYITHIERGGFYGWPWFYTGGNQDPRQAGKHPELKSKVIVPDVLLQPHNASLQMMFYEGAQFPAEYRGDIFAAQHGSWNRSVRSGYEVIRVPLKDGNANGVYEDFLTGFVLENGAVWGRPVGVAAASDGSLLVSDDGSGSIWRVSHEVSSAGVLTATSAASYVAGTLAPEAICTLFGAGLASSSVTASATPLPTSIDGVQVQIRDSAGVTRDAPLFYVSPTQISFQNPPGVNSGAATITVLRNGSTVGQGTAVVEQVTPGLFTANANGQGVAAAFALRVRADGSQTLEPLSQLNPSTNKYETLQLSIGPASDQLFLLAFGTGFRSRTSLANVTATVGGTNAEVTYAGAQGGFTGLDQANIRIPASLSGRGDVDVVLSVDGKRANTVVINVE